MTLAILIGGYPMFTAALILIDKLTGWQISEAFGKKAPNAR
jgi:hypothetical protein